MGGATKLVKGELDRIQKEYINKKLKRLDTLETNIEEVITDFEYKYLTKCQEYFKAEEVLKTLESLKNGSKE